MIFLSLGLWGTPAQSKLLSEVFDFMEFAPVQ